MDYAFSYNLPIIGIDIEGTASVEEGGMNSDGEICFVIDGIQFRYGEFNLRPSFEETAAGTAIIAWVKSMLEADEDLQAAWDAHIGNDELPGYGRPVVYSTYNVQSGSVA